MACKGRRHRVWGRARMPLALRAYEYSLLSYRRTWRGSLTTTFLYPLLYLAAIGVGLGHLIDRGSNNAVDGVRYIWFLAPGLLAGTAMQIGTNESTFPVMAGIKWLKTYLAMLATPLEVTDVLYGHFLWILTRVGLAAGVFLGRHGCLRHRRVPLGAGGFPCRGPHRRRLFRPGDGL